MKKLIPLFVFIIVFGCKEDNPVEPKKEANIIVDGVYTKSMTSYNSPQLIGYVKNTGSATGYNCMVEISAFKGNAIIDVAKGFPADLSDIPVGVRASFDAVFFNLNSHSDYDRLTTKVTFLTR